MKPNPLPPLLTFVLGAIYVWNCTERKHFFSSKVGLGCSLLAPFITTAVHYAFCVQGLCRQEETQIKKRKHEREKKKELHLVGGRKGAEASSTS